MTKIDEKFNDFKIAIIAEIREQIKQEVSEALEKEIKKGKNWNPVIELCFTTVGRI